MCGWKRLEALPAEVGQLAQLAELDLSYCEELVELPASLAGLTALTSLRLAGCAKLHTLPPAACDLRALAHLALDATWHTGEMQQWSVLPAGAGSLQRLARLDLSR